MNLSSDPAAIADDGVPHPARRGSPSLAVWGALTGGLYFVFAWGGIDLARLPFHTTLWYPNAIAILMLQPRPYKNWPVLVTIALLASIAANTVFGEPLGQTALFVLPNAVEILLGGYLLRRFCTPADSVANPGQLLKSLFYGGILPALLGGGLFALVAPGSGMTHFEANLIIYFEDSAIGAVALLPFGFLLLDRGWRGAAEVLRRIDVVLLLLIMPVGMTVWASTALPFPFVYIGAGLLLIAYLGRFAAASMGAVLCSLSAGIIIARGNSLLPLYSRPFSEVLIYLPAILTLVPPLLFAATLEQVRKTVRELARREAHFRSMYHLTPVMMQSIDLDQKLVSVNERWATRLGYAAEEAIGRLYRDFMTPESQRQAAEVVFPRFLETGVATDIPFDLVSRTGDIVHVELSAIWEKNAAGEKTRSLAVLKDVTEQKRLAAELEAEQERIAVTLHSIGDGVVTIDERGCIAYLNPVAEKILGWPLTEAKGCPFGDIVQLFHQAPGAPRLDPVETYSWRDSGGCLPETAILRDRQSRDYGVQITAAPILAHDESLIGTVMVFKDVTEAIGLAQKMSYLAHHDGLTDLPNRVLFQDRVNQACQLGERHQRHFAVIFMDLDHFKTINDSMGHLLGDELLRVVARRLTGALRATDTVCRLGGDEFVMLLSEINGPEEVADVARKILDIVGAPCRLGGAEVQIGISLGIALFPEDGKNPETLVNHADGAMYRAKRDGRNRFHFFSNDAGKAAGAWLPGDGERRVRETG